MAKRGAMWSAGDQLDIFNADATEPHDSMSLYYAGDISLIKRPCVSIVGIRKATPPGLQRASRLARELVEHGVVIVSGLAKGIDTAAHLSTLVDSDFGGPSRTSYRERPETWGRLDLSARARRDRRTATAGAESRRSRKVLSRPKEVGFGVADVLTGSFRSANCAAWADATAAAC
jgi:broad specificity phosphatase PhoE